MERSEGLKGLRENLPSTRNSTTFLSRNYILHRGEKRPIFFPQFARCKKMKKADRSREVPKWKDLDRDILALIFHKLDVIDIINGASRVCISWFLASHDKTVWNTLDITKIQHEGMNLRNLLIQITNLSHTVPKNLFFSFGFYLEEEDLVFVAERLPNIEKLVLPYRIYSTDKYCRFAFSQWKNLKTLIIAPYLPGLKIFEYQAVGENCSNLINFKYLGCLVKEDADQIVCYLKNIKRLSLRCSSISIIAVLLVIKGLKDLSILNLAHCEDLDQYPYLISNADLLQAATHKLDKFITCPNNCKICQDQCRFFWSYYSKDWMNDEIKEFQI